RPIRLLPGRCSPGTRGAYIRRPAERPTHGLFLAFPLLVEVEVNCSCRHRAGARLRIGSRAMKLKGTSKTMPKKLCSRCLHTRGFRLRSKMCPDSESSCDKLFSGA